MESRPNILLLFTDQQRWDTLAAAGCPWMQTPNLDRLAARGTLFTQAFCNSPLCMPSRQSMLSGRYPASAGCTENGVEMREDMPHAATILGAAGYHTANIGKLHFKNHSHRDHRDPHPSYGFDTLLISDEPGMYEDPYSTWLKSRGLDDIRTWKLESFPGRGHDFRISGPSRKVTDPIPFEGPDDASHSSWVAQETCQFLSQHVNDPFFCIAGFFAPHSPVNPPQKWLDAYRDTEVPLPEMNDSERENLGLSDEEWISIRRAYYALVSHVDEELGRILDHLDNLGLTENTLVVFTSDHGDHLGDHGKIHKGPPGLDSCAHVPMIVSPPGSMEVPRGIRCNELVELVDFLPTCLDFARIPCPPFLQGKSLKPLVMDSGDEVFQRNSVFIEWRRAYEDGWKAVRTHEAWYARSRGGEEMLFDLREDPHQLTNVVEDPSYRDLWDQMRREMLAKIFEVEDQGRRASGRY
ncbi:sulfatase-like hydrolase/transferase [Kiritimatiellaeota bacterium B1221]|nr:sulfatase-like hydrolase/transferase [Kiritimatiellaeota bacterium B1221]